MLNLQDDYTFSGKRTQIMLLQQTKKLLEIQKHESLEQLK